MVFNHVLHEIQHLARLKEAKGSAFVLAGTITTSVLGFISMFLLARYFGPRDFGIFSIFYTTVMLITFFFEQGVSVTTIHFYNKYKGIKQQIVQKVIFKLRAISMLFIFALGYLLSPFIAKNLFNKPELTTSFQMASIAVFMITFVFFFLSILRAQERYPQFSLVRATYLGGATGLIILFVLLEKITLVAAMRFYIITPIIAVLLSLLFVKTSFFKAKGNEKAILNTIINFSKWIFFSAVFFAVARNLLTFLIGKFSTLEEVGRFSVAYQVSHGIFIVLSSFLVVLFSSASKIKSIKRAKSFIIKSTTILSLICIPILIFLMLFAEPIIMYIFGNAYSGITGTIVILFLANIFLIISSPFLSIILNFFEHTKEMFLINLSFFILVLVLGVVGLKTFGMIGGAIGYAISLFAVLMGRVYVYRKLMANKS